jgi:predicted peptidase
MVRSATEGGRRVKLVTAWLPRDWAIRILKETEREAQQAPPAMGTSGDPRDRWPSFLARTFTDSRGYVLPYRMLMPSMRPALVDPVIRQAHPQQVPLVLALHGAGERGDDNSAQLRNGVAELLGSDEAAARFPCFYVVPQCAKDDQWVKVHGERHVLPEKLSKPLSAVMELVDELLSHHPIDPQRIYLIGLSMGGFGVWDLLSRWPARFAAAVSICGGANENAVVAARAVPVWVFHGDRDQVVRVERSRRTVDVLRKAGSTAHYTEYPNVAHDSWVKAFAEPDLLPWLFSNYRTTT